MEDIEMESPMAEATSGKKRGSLSPLFSSTTKRVKLDQDELTSLNVELNDAARLGSWSHLLQRASIDKDPRKMTSVLSTILAYLIDALAETSVKFNFISRLTASAAQKIVEDFDPNERREWEDGIRMCMEHGDWGDLITHRAYTVMGTAILEEPEVARASSETWSEQAQRLHGMFIRKYHGDFHKLFVGALDVYEKIYNPKKHFGRIIPIIQSSATGKSRMVREIGSEVPTLSICFRQSPLPESGWPPSDEPAHRFLLGERPEDKRFKGEELAAAFLGAVMAVVAEKIEARGDSASLGGDWMYDWRLDSAINITHSRRYSYFTEVAARAEKLLIDNRTAIVDTRVASNMQYIAVGTTIDSALVWHKKLFTMLCCPSFEMLSKVLKKRNAKWFVLAVDECSELDSTKPVPLPGGRPYWAPTWSMSLVALRRIIKVYDEFVAEVPVWFLFLDTNSSVIDMASLGKEAPSAFEKGYGSLPAWPYVGFNQMARKNVFAPVNEEKLPTHVHSMQHLKLYGRPYWSTLTNDEVLGVASKKLFSDYGFRPNQETHVFAAFAVRVGLEIGVGEASERLAMEVVRSHMRILDAVVGSMLITTSPPEPMLAIAAAMEMNLSEETYKTALNTLLNKLILKGVVFDRGLLGELSSRLLLLRTRDKATSGGNGPVKIDRIRRQPMVEPVELSKFLQTLLGDTLGLPDEQRDIRDKLLEEASSVWINFTHIFQLPRSIGEVTESMLLNAWSTGAAFQCAYNQPVIDGFIVGYRGSLNQPFQSSRLITIPWQSKAKSTAASAPAHSLTAPFIVPQNGGSRYKPWHVVILMDLTASSASGNVRGPHCDLTSEKAVRPTRGEEGQEVWKSYAETNETEGQRYCLNIRGHRADDYPVLNGLKKQFDTLFMRALSCPEPEFVPYAEIMAKAERVV